MIESLRANPLLLPYHLQIFVKVMFYSIKSTLKKNSERCSVKEGERLKSMTMIEDKSLCRLQGVKKLSHGQLSSAFHRGEL